MTLRLKFSHFELRSSNVSFVSEAALYIFLSFPLPNKIQPHPHPPPPHTHTHILYYYYYYYYHHHHHHHHHHHPIKPLCFSVTLLGIVRGYR